jgi:predicted flavoprotein YhiN
MGGIYTDQLDAHSLMVKKIPGLFLAGEIIDITGDCGGFNLQWAWSSGYAAALGAVEFLR